MIYRITSLMACLLLSFPLFANSVKLTVTSTISNHAATVTLTNPGNTAASNWSGSFVINHGKFNDSWGISNIHTQATATGERVTVSPVSWNQTIPAHQTVSFGFNFTAGTVSGYDFNADVLGPPIPGKGFPKQFFAPYVDVLNYPLFSLQDDYHQTGQKYYTLAFMTADKAGKPSWGGIIPLSDYYFSDQINAIRQLGGDVIISLGGAAGTPIAAATTSTLDLADEYEAIINDYHLTRIDFDVEGVWVADHASIDRRNAALALVQKDFPDLKIDYCLPILVQGLTADGLYVLQSAINYGVNVNVVNAMTMDFGDDSAPNPDHKMGAYVIQSATSLFNQLKALYPNLTDETVWSMIGMTPMIGQNDVGSEVVWQSDAKEIVAFALQHPLKLLAMWSSNRDNGDTRDVNASTTYSGVMQTPCEFTKIFQGILL